LACANETLTGASQLAETLSNRTPSKLTETLAAQRDHALIIKKTLLPTSKLGPALDHGHSIRLILRGGALKTPGTVAVPHDGGVICVDGFVIGDHSARMCWRLPRG
jgi:hypothetical protein